MITWKEKIKQLKLITKQEMTIIDSLAYLHSLRIKKGISQSELAKKIGMKQPQLAKIESMTSIPSLETLTRYAKGLGLVATIQFKPAKTEA